MPHSTACIAEVSLKGPSLDGKNSHRTVQNTNNAQNIMSTTKFIAHYTEYLFS